MTALQTPASFNPANNLTFSGKKKKVNREDLRAAFDQLDIKYEAPVSDRHLEAALAHLKELKKTSFPFVGYLDKVFQIDGVKPEETAATLTELGYSLQSLYKLPVIPGKIEGEYQGRDFTMELAGQGAHGIVYKLTFGDKDFAFKVLKPKYFHQLDPYHNGPSELAIIDVLCKYQLKDMENVYCGFYPYWTLTEFIHKDACPSERDGITLEELKKLEGLEYVDNTEDNFNPKGVRYEAGGVIATGGDEDETDNRQAGSIKLKIHEALGDVLDKGWHSTQDLYTRFVIGRRRSSEPVLKILYKLARYSKEPGGHYDYLLQKHLNECLPDLKINAVKSVPTPGPS